MQAFETGEACILLRDMVALETRLYHLPLTPAVVGESACRLWTDRRVTQVELSDKIDTAAKAMVTAALKAPAAPKEAPCPGHRHNTFKLYQSRLQQACADAMTFQAAGEGGVAGGSGSGRSGGGSQAGCVAAAPAPTPPPSINIDTAHGTMGIAVGMTVACTYNSGPRYFKGTILRISKGSSTVSVLFCDNYTWEAAPFSDLQPWVVPGDRARVAQGNRMVLVEVSEVLDDGILAVPIKKNLSHSTQGAQFVADIDVQPDKDTPFKLHQARMKAARVIAPAPEDPYAARAEVVEGVSRSGRHRTALQLRAPQADSSGSRKRLRVGLPSGGSSADGDASHDGGASGLGGGSSTGAGGMTRKRKAATTADSDSDSDSDGEVLNYDSDDGAPRDADGEAELDPSRDKALPPHVRDMHMADFCFQVVTSVIASLRAYNFSAASLCAFPAYIEPCLLDPRAVVLEGRVRKSPLPSCDRTVILAAMDRAKEALVELCRPEAPAAPPSTPVLSPSAWADDGDDMPSDLAHSSGAASAEQEQVSDDRTRKRCDSIIVV